MRPTGKPEVLEKRRRYAIRLLRKGMAFRAVAAQTHASLSSVVRWHQAYQKEGRGGLRSKHTPGRPPRLSRAKKQKLIGILSKG